MKVRVGDSALTRDLVWCECGRGLSLSGKWLYCPSCGERIDQESYHSAVEQAKLNGATSYIDPEMVKKLLTSERAKQELLEAARLLLEGAESEGWHVARGTDESRTGIAELRAAIAKAEGRS